MENLFAGKRMQYFAVSCTKGKRVLALIPSLSFGKNIPFLTDSVAMAPFNSVIPEHNNFVAGTDSRLSGTVPIPYFNMNVCLFRACAFSTVT